MELELLFESRDDAKPTEEMLHEILASRAGLIGHLKLAGLAVDDATLLPPAEFPKGAKKFLVKLSMAFLLGAAGESGKVAADKVLQYYEQRFPDAGIEVRAALPPPPPPFKA
jgi:hypothetical protein